MKAVYKDKLVKVVKLIVERNKFINKPILVQVKIEYKENGETISDYADASQIEFI